jgi:prepilin-type N-terminal cleavage/methylation domain-containing protein
MSAEVMMPRREGFTLIELLIVMVLVAILATIGVNRFWAAKDRSLLSTITSDIRNMAAEQEVYFEKNLAYASAVTDLVDFTPSPGVAIKITYAMSDGWAANGTHGSLVTGQCGIFTGNAPALTGAPATVQGVIACN